VRGRPFTAIRVPLGSTGIGDVIPLTGYARSLAAVEMFVGVMYLAPVVARLIGLSLLPPK
jgi:hypothetical protein